MLKKTTFVLLVFSLTILVWENYTTLQESYEITYSPDKARVIPSGRDVEKVSFYPSPPAPLPDLTEGYIFNSERHLVTKEESKKEVKEKIQGPEINMKGLIYSGSIIMGKSRKALVSYEKIVKGKQDQPFSGKAKQRQSTGEREYALLGISDKLGRYRVTAVEPERMVFQKGGESIEKRLYQQEINRIITPSIRRDENKKMRIIRSTSSSQKQDEREERAVFSHRPGEKNSSKKKKDSEEERRHEIRIPFR